MSVFLFDEIRTQETKTMALKQLIQWNTVSGKVEASASCGTACGSSDKPDQGDSSSKPESASCGTACGAGDK